MIDLPRRKFLVGAASLLAAPAVIRVARLMPVRPFMGRALVALASRWPRAAPLINDEHLRNVFLRSRQLGMTRASVAFAEFELRTILNDWTGYEDVA